MEIYLFIKFVELFVIDLFYEKNKENKSKINGKIK